MAQRVQLLTQAATVNGLGGVGKTTLAAEFAREQRCRFPGGVLWLEAESEAALGAAVLRLATRSLALLEAEGATVDDAREALKAWLADAACGRVGAMCLKSKDDGFKFNGCGAWLEHCQAL